MFFPRSFALALLSAPLLVLAQSANPFKVPSSGLSATAGQGLTLSWNPTTQGTVSLVLRSGSSNNLEAGTFIASKISNSGSYTWNVPSTITRGSDYTVEIVDDSDPSQTNYTPYFVLDSDVTVAYSTSQVTLGAQSATLPASTASPTGSASDFLSTVSSTASSGSVTSSAASSDSTSTESSSASGATTASSTLATSTTSGSPTSSTSSAGLATNTSSAGAIKVPTYIGMLGLIGLGAVAF